MPEILYVNHKFHLLSARHTDKERAATCKHTSILDFLCPRPGAVRSVPAHDLRVLSGYPRPVLPGGSAGAGLCNCIEGCTASFAVFAQTTVYS